MSRVEQIEVSNFKAISSLTATFKGCTAIMQGRNNSGKTSFLRGIIDRIRGIKPSIVLKHEEHEGFCRIALTDGCQFIWSFTDKTKQGETLKYVTDKGIKTNATREICDRYFPESFDVDAFLNGTPTYQRKELQKLVGLDFTDVDARYQTAFNERTSRNTTVSNAKARLDATPVPEAVEKVDIEEIKTRIAAKKKELNDLFIANRKHNTELREKWQQEREEANNLWRRQNQEAEALVEEHNKQQQELIERIYNVGSALDLLQSARFNETQSIVDFKSTLELEQQPVKKHTWTVLEPLCEPTYIEEMPAREPLDLLEQELEQAHEINRKAALYTAWITLRDEHHKAIELAAEADANVKSIAKERENMIKSATMPEGFSFSDDGILYNNLPFNRQQLSSSGIYIGALKLAAMRLAEARTLHFDASFLDYPSLKEIEAWADTQDIQLLIEWPDREGKEITYEIIEK